MGWDGDAFIHCAIHTVLVGYLVDCSQMRHDIPWGWVLQELLACFSQSLHLKAFVCSEHFGRSCFPLPNHVCCVHPVARTFSASYFVVCSCCSESSALSFANSFYLLFLCLHPTFSWSCLNHKPVKGFIIRPSDIVFPRIPLDLLAPLFHSFWRQIH